MLRIEWHMIIMFLPYRCNSASQCKHNLAWVTCNIERHACCIRNSSCRLLIDKLLRQGEYCSLTKYIGITQDDESGAEPSALYQELLASFSMPTFEQYLTSSLHTYSWTCPSCWSSPACDYNMYQTKNKSKINSMVYKSCIPSRSAATLHIIS